MSKKQDIKHELEELDSPILAKWQGKSDDWTMPKHYLEDLSNKVIAESKQEKKATIVPFNRSIVWKIAAAILLLLTSTWLFLDLPTQNDSLPLVAVNLDDFSSQEIHDYMLDNIDDFDVELLETYAMDIDEDLSFEIEDEILDELNLEGDWLEENTEIDLF